MPLRSRFAARAARRNRRRQLIARAPRVSATIDASFGVAFTRVVRAFSARVKETLAPQLRQDAPPAKMIATLSLKTQAQQASAQFRETAFQTARRLEKFSKSEASRWLGDLASDLPTTVPGFADRFADDTTARLEGLLNAALDAVTLGVDELTAEEIAAGEAEVLVGEVMDGWLSRAIQSARNLISSATTDLTKERSQSVGVDGYVWISMHDAKTRPEHAALDDGSIYSWDAPPLSGAESDCGDDCHPGQDYECRCMAVPAVGEATGEAAAEEEVA
jgi:SPP1 gp7 family putative phage head morphogenesis protein